MKVAQQGGSKPALMKASIAIALLILCLIPGVLLILVFRGGVVWQGDAVAYLSAAQQLESGQLPTNFKWWPIAYPVALALASSVAGGSLNGAMLLAVVGSGLLIFATFTLVHILTKSNLLALGASGFMALSPGLLETAWTPQSDLLFAVLCTGTLVFLTKALMHDRNTTVWLAVGALFAALATMTRYSGIALIPSVAITALLLPATHTLTRGLRVVAASFIATTGYLLNGVWHRSIGLAWGGVDRSDVIDRSITEVASAALIGIGRLVVPPRFELAALTMGIAIAVVVLTSSLLALKSKSPGVVPSGVFVFVFWTTFAVAMLEWLPQTQDARYALAVQPALLATLAFFVAPLIRKARSRRAFWIAVSTAGLLLFIQLIRLVNLLITRPETSHQLLIL